MARKYKKNRERGTRKSQYRETVVAGFVIPKRPAKGGKEEYLKQFTERNIGMLEKSYAEEYRHIQASGFGQQFKAKYPTVKEYVRHFFGKDKITKKLLMHAVETKFASLTYKQSMHIYNLLKSNEDFLEELQLKAGESIEANRLGYTGDSVFTYITASGKTIKFRFTDYSPAILEFLDEDENE